jgi:hypothetical protein
VDYLDKSLLIRVASKYLRNRNLLRMTRRGYFNKQAHVPRLKHCERFANVVFMYASDRINYLDYGSHKVSLKKSSGTVLQEVYLTLTQSSFETIKVHVQAT